MPDGKRRYPQLRGFGEVDTWLSGLRMPQAWSAWKSQVGGWDKSLNQFWANLAKGKFEFPRPPAQAAPPAWLGTGGMRGVEQYPFMAFPGNLTEPEWAGRYGQYGQQSRGIMEGQLTQLAYDLGLPDWYINQIPSLPMDAMEQQIALYRGKLEGQLNQPRGRQNQPMLNYSEYSANYDQWRQDVIKGREQQGQLFRGYYVNWFDLEDTLQSAKDLDPELAQQIQDLYESEVTKMLGYGSTYAGAPAETVEYYGDERYGGTSAEVSETLGGGAGRTDEGLVRAQTAARITSSPEFQNLLMKLETKRLTEEPELYNAYLEYKQGAVGGTTLIMPLSSQFRQGGGRMKTTGFQTDYLLTYEEWKAQSPAVQAYLAEKKKMTQEEARFEETRVRPPRWAIAEQRA